MGQLLIIDYITDHYFNANYEILLFKILVIFKGQMNAFQSCTLAKTTNNTK